MIAGDILNKALEVQSILMDGDVGTITGVLSKFCTENRQCAHAFRISQHTASVLTRPIRSKEIRIGHSLIPFIAVENRLHPLAVGFEVVEQEPIVLVADCHLIE